MSDPAPSRAILAISGEDAVHFLQGILTQDVARLAAEKIQFAALLSPQGKILHDMFLVAEGGRILLDTPAAGKAMLLKRLGLYKLRAKVAIEEAPEWGLAIGGKEGLADPRHAALPRRMYGKELVTGHAADALYRDACLALGIPDSTIDFGPDEVVALDAGYDLLHGVSFTKGCYIGQEITARMHYKNIARRGFFILARDAVPKRLALLKFEEFEKAQGRITFDGVEYQATLPEWMTPKFAQFKTAQAASSF